MCEYKNILIFQLENTTDFWVWNKRLHGYANAVTRLYRQCLKDIESQELEHNRRGAKELEVRLNKFARKYVRRPQDTRWRKKRFIDFESLDLDW